MKNCQHCGRQIGDTEFCPHCGQKQNAQQVQSVNRRRLHCPHCKSVQLTALVESKQTGGVATHSKVTKRVGITSYSANTENRHYWMCRDCGHKFRNLEDLKSELVSANKIVKVSRIMSIIFGILCLLTLLFAFSDPMAFVMMIVPFIACVAMEAVFLVLWLSYKKNVESMTADEAYLEKNCFD